MLIVIAAKLGVVAFAGALERSAAQQIIEAVGLLAAAVVALQIAQTIVEEEVVRDAHISGPTRVRRFLSRFLVVVVVALTIEGLVATFKAAHEDPAQMLFVSVGTLLAFAMICAGTMYLRIRHPELARLQDCGVVAHRAARYRLLRLSDREPSGDDLLAVAHLDGPRARHLRHVRPLASGP